MNNHNTQSENVKVFQVARSLLNYTHLPAFLSIALTIASAINPSPITSAISLDASDQNQFNIAAVTQPAIRGFDYRQRV